MADYHWVDLGLRRNLQETTLSFLQLAEFGYEFLGSMGFL